MQSSRVMTNLLRGGVSLVALSAAWGLPTAAQAQTCETAATIDGVAPGTAVTCPFSTVLTFPGAVSQGPGGVPNGSQLLGVLNGTDPTHQQWTFQDANGNVQFIFLSGDYNLRNGIGGTTVLQGPALLGLAGAGACGAGGLTCPGSDPKFRTASNLTAPTGGGAAGGFILPTVTEYFGPTTTGFQGVEVADLNATACDVMPTGASCDPSFRFGPAITGAEPGSGVTAAPLGSDITIHGTGFDDFYLDIAVLPEDLAQDFSSCSASSPASCAMVVDDKGDAFVFTPESTLGIPEFETNYVVTGTNGVTVIGATAGPRLPGANRFTDLRGLFVQHVSNANAIVAGGTKSNLSGTTGAGVQGAFSIPGAVDSFLLTQPIQPSQAGGNTFSYVISYPVKPLGDYSLYDFGPDAGGVFVDQNSLPEVTKVTPGRNASGTNPATSFVLTFSQPMDTATVEDNFIIRSFSDKQLAVAGNGDRAEDGGPEFDNDIWDDSAFDIDWNDDGTEATLWVEKGGRLDDEKATLDYYYGPVIAVSLNNSPETAIDFQTPEPPDPGSGFETGRALGLLFDIYAKPESGAQAAQASDVATAGIPTQGGTRDSGALR